MGLPKELADRLKTLIQREPVTVPELGAEFVVRGLTTGEMNRANAHPRTSEVLIAIATELDGRQLWDPNNADDLDEIAAFKGPDTMALVTTIVRLSGMDRMGNDFSPPPESLSSHSPEY
jgi:hypothetical protein